MAVYKVPQDVEADDKLLGPFSFKQFIFLIIMVMSLALAYGLSRISLPLAIIPLPIAIFFGALALPLRKDQPMEVYLAAIISFIMKPKVRLWRPDGIEALIEVIAPRNEERNYGKGYSEEEVQRRLSYLANLVDSRGWSVRGVDEPNNPMRQELYNEAQAMDDLLDDQGVRAQQIDGLLAQSHERRRQEIRQQMTTPIVPAQMQEQPSPAPQPYAPQPQILTADQYSQVPQMVQPSAQNYQTPYQQPPQPQQIMSTGHTPMTIVQPEHPGDDIRLVVNPYPKMNQSVITPLSERTIEPQPALQPMAQPQPQPEPEPAPVPEPVSSAIMDLANRPHLSVETLQHEAERIKQREIEKEEGEEVVISLR